MTDRAEHTAFTPGPWRLAPASAYAGTDLNIDAGQNGTGDYICSAGQRGDANSEANALLIAAAPDLLAALREARETILQLKNSRWSECEGSDAEWVGGLDVVIARATGEA